MTKTLAFVIIAMMAMHLLKPLGVPGLRYRRDVWKIAVFALIAMGIAVGLGHIV